MHRRSCLLAFALVAACVFLVFFFTRSLEIKREFRLAGPSLDRHVYHVWSYGDWHETRRLGLHVSALVPPYTLVLAIESDTSFPAVIEMVRAEIVFKNGDRRNVISHLESLKDEIRIRPNSKLARPHSVFRFDHAIESFTDFSLEIEFLVNGKDSRKVIKQTLSIECFESRKRGSLILDSMLSASIHRSCDLRSPLEFPKRS